MFGLPIVSIVLFECSLNYAFAGQPRLSTGTAGQSMWAYRVRAFQGAPPPDTDEADRLAALLPERHPDDAFVGSGWDSWVAFYRAVRQRGWDVWQFDDTCRSAALASIRADPGTFLKYSAALTARHLLRQGEGFPLTPVPESKRREILLHHDAPTGDNGGARRYRYLWWLPQLPADQATRFFDRLKTRAAERAPFGDHRIFALLRHCKTKPQVVAFLDAALYLAKIWPGFAIILCGLLRLNRTTCVILGLIYFAEASFISTVSVTSERFQFVWLATDTTLAAALATVGVVRGCEKLRAWFAGAPSSARRRDRYERPRCFE
jgi:hypothetical protein